MLYFNSERAREIVVSSVERYEKHFKIDFPIFEYIESEEVTVEVAYNLKELINKHIENDSPVATPSDYNERLY